jgi:hypothetical protein
MNPPVKSGLIAPKVTEGEWKTHLVDGLAIVDAEGGDIAEVKGDYQEDWAVMEANAQMLAASKKLAEALAELVELEVLRARLYGRDPQAQKAIDALKLAGYTER